MPKPYREITAVNNKFDMWRLGQAGGRVAFNKRNQPVFRFDTKAQFNKYMELNSKRGEWVS